MKKLLFFIILCSLFSCSTETQEEQPVVTGKNFALSLYSTDSIYQSGIDSLFLFYFPESSTPAKPIYFQQELAWGDPVAFQDLEPEPYTFITIACSGSLEELKDHMVFYRDCIGIEKHENTSGNLFGGVLKADPISGEKKFELQRLVGGIKVNITNLDSLNIQNTPDCYITNSPAEIYLGNYEGELEYYGKYIPTDNSWNYIFPTNELLGNMVPADQPAMKTIFNVDEEHQLATENWLKNYTTNTDTALDYLSKVTLRQTFDGMINMYRLVGGALCAILALIGILNFINSMTTSILSRYREIAMLQSVGMTGRQVKQMLIYEGIGYSILGLFGSLILSVIASLTVVRMMGAELTYFTWHFTLLPVFLCIIPLILITAIVPLVCYNKMAQKTVVERLRIAE